MPDRLFGGHDPRLQERRGVADLHLVRNRRPVFRRRRLGLLRPRRLVDLVNRQVEHALKQRVQFVELLPGRVDGGRPW
jgi:hypothetical protein